MMDSQLPRWTVIYDDIKERIKGGGIRPGDEVSADRLGYDRRDKDFKKVIEILEEEDLVEKKKGGYFFKGKPNRSYRSTDFFTDHSKSGNVPKIENLELELVPVEKIERDEARERLSSISNIAVRHQSLQYVNDNPVAISDAYYPYDVCSEIYNILENPNSPLYKKLEKHGYKPEKINEVLYVDYPQKEERVHLDILKSDRVNVVRICRTTFTKNIPIEVVYLCDRADYYTFEYSFTYSEDN